MFVFHLCLLRCSAKDLCIEEMIMLFIFVRSKLAEPKLCDREPICILFWMLMLMKCRFITTCDKSFDNDNYFTTEQLYESVHHHWFEFEEQKCMRLQNWLREHYLFLWSVEKITKKSSPYRPINL